MTLPIVFHDDCLIAINKPPGLLVHKSALDRHNTVAAVQLLRDQVGRKVYPVHRLDRPTSGILLFAYSPDMVKRVQENWQDGTEKGYQALVRGWLKGSGFIDYALKYQPDKLTEKHKKVDNYQSAQTYYQACHHYQVPIAVGRYPSARYTLVDLWPYTGRKHQLRRHMAHLRHPIIADTSHGDGKHNAAMRAQFGCQSLALSCTHLAFIHPQTQQRVVITSPRSDNFNQCLAQLAQYEVN